MKTQVTNTAAQLASEVANTLGFVAHPTHKNIWWNRNLFIQVEGGKAWIGRPFFRKAFANLQDAQAKMAVVGTLMNGQKIY